MDIMVLESDDVADAIYKAVQDHGISELVIGASSSVIFSWYKISKTSFKSFGIFQFLKLYFVFFCFLQEVEEKQLVFKDFRCYTKILHRPRYL